MASKPVLDIEKLTQPVAGDNPAGKDLAEDSSPTSLYYVIRNARSAARDAERYVPDTNETRREADWNPILNEVPKALEESKNLEITAYLIEALVRSHGFAGLRDGFALARQLVEKFWDGLYPLPDEYGISTRVAALAGLNGEERDGTLIVPITNVQITDGSSTGPFCLSDYQRATELARMTDVKLRKQRIDQGAVTREQFEKAANETPAQYFIDLLDDLKACRDEFDKLNDALSARCGDEAPPSTNIRRVLTECYETVELLGKPKLAARGGGGGGGGASEAPGTETGGDSAEPVAQTAPLGTIRSREDALRTLIKVADYYKEHEPHSPVSYVLEQAVSWGNMALPDLLNELVADENVRKSIFRLVGIKPPPKGG